VLEEENKKLKKIADHILSEPNKDPAVAAWKIQVDGVDKPILHDTMRIQSRIELIAWLVLFCEFWIELEVDYGWR
jgi:hypothetical protein